MKMSKVAYSLVLAMGVAAFGAQAANEGTGRITFTGSIIDAACSVAPESEDFVVPLGEIAAAQLADGKNPIRNPSRSNWKTVPSPLTLAPAPVQQRLKR